VSLETLKTAILSEANSQAQAIQAQADATKAKEESRVKQKASALEEAIITAASKTAANQAAKIHQAARLQAKAAVLRAKQTELDITRQQVIERLLTQDEAKSTSLIKALLKSLPNQDGAIIAGDKQKELVTHLAQAAGFTVAKETFKNDGGFIHRLKSQETNFTLRHLVNQIFEKHRAAIAQILFA